ncbi:MAG: SIS domain-containing protein [Firmicutes bacterium]|jgi:arabinose-5-phosphate isomerase|nr:SIS domain-containing protein [Bacillota bacterium]MDH7495722.1 SIS domain-containing protein [Bacillota bacterium]
MNDKEILALLRDTIMKEARMLQMVADQVDDGYIGALKLVLGCKGHVFVTGVGTSHAMAWRLAHLLSCSGAPSVFIHATDSLHGSSGAITPNDVLIAISKGGETDEVIEFSKIARRRGASVIAMTEAPESTLASMADQVVIVRVPAEADPFGMIATGSSLANGIAGDALCVAVQQLKGYTKESFAVTHPGGAVGKTLRKEAQA